MCSAIVHSLITHHCERIFRSMEAFDLSVGPSGHRLHTWSTEIITIMHIHCIQKHWWLNHMFLPPIR